MGCVMCIEDLIIKLQQYIVRHLCAVLLFCTVTDYTVRDVSTLKPAALQVSTDNDQHSARYANDGNGQTCAASKPETNPWWAVDLQEPTLVFMVKLTNSGDAKGIWHCILLVTFIVAYVFSDYTIS